MSSKAVIQESITLTNMLQKEASHGYNLGIVILYCSDDERAMLRTILQRAKENRESKTKAA